MISNITTQGSGVFKILLLPSGYFFFFFLAQNKEFLFIVKPFFCLLFLSIKKYLKNSVE